MAKTFSFTIGVSTNADCTADQVADLLKRLINVGLSDAAEVLEAGEGDLEASELATSLILSAPVPAATETSVAVKHLTAYSGEVPVPTHQFDINDGRVTNGQAVVTVGALEGGLDDVLSVKIEVTTNPLNGIDHVPCAHVHFDADSLAVSLFKIGDKILVRPETNVTIQSFLQKVDGFGEELYWIDDK
jgi:hypothetical protein